MHILVVATEPPPQTLAHIFENCGITFSTCAEMDTACEYIKSSYPDGVMAFRLSPEDVSVLRDAAARADRRIAVFAVMGKASVLDRVNLLRSGVGHCYIEPFSYTRLIYDIGSVGYRTERPGLTYGGFTVQPDQQCIHFSGQPLKLSARQFRLLFLLLRRSNQVVSRISIWEEVWGEGDYPLSNTIDSLIYRLKQRIPPSQEWELEQVYGIGYRLIVRTSQQSSQSPVLSQAQK